MAYIPIKTSGSTTRGKYIPIGGYAPPPETRPSTASGYGSAPQIDPYSGKSLLEVPTRIPATYNAPERYIPIVDSRRVSTVFDPTKAQPITREMLANGRLPSSASQALRSELGAGYNEELDHQIALTLAGSNKNVNLKMLSTKANQAAGHIETKLANDVIAGRISLLDAQLQDAKQKGITLPETPPDFLQRIREKALILPPFVLEPLAEVQKNPIKAIGKGIKFLFNYGKQAATHPIETLAGAGTEALNFSLGLVKTGSSLIGQKEMVGLIQKNQDALDQIIKDNIPEGDKQKAFDAGEFLGAVLPYAVTGTTAQKVGAKIVEKVLPGTILEGLVKRAGALSSIVQVGQIEYNPKDGSRVEQLKKDLIITAVFATGGLLFKGASKIYEPLAKKVEPEIKPIIDSMAAREKVKLEDGEKAVENAKKIIAKETGKQPEEIIGEAARKGEISVVETATKELEPLAKEARKYKTAEEFEKAFLGEIKHGQYWHVTDNPNFKIDSTKGPRDLVSTGVGKEAKGKLMITSDLDNWTDTFIERKFAALIDMSKVDSKDFSQVNRQFGNEFFVENPANARVSKVIPVEEALKESANFQKALEGTIKNKTDLTDFFNKVKGAELPKIEVQPEETGVRLTSGLDPGLDKFISEDVKPFLDNAKELTTRLVSSVRAVPRAIQNIFQPERSARLGVGQETTSQVIRGIHTPEAELVRFNTAKSRTFDKNFNELEQWFNKFKPEELQNFELSRGTPRTTGGLIIQADAKKALPEALKDPNLIGGVRDASDYVFKLAKGNGLDINYFEDYFYGKYKDSSKVSTFLDYWRSTEGYTKAKTFPSVADAADWGLQLKDPNPITNIKSELRVVAQRVGLKQIQDLNVKSNAEFMVKSDEANAIQRQSWKKINDPVFKNHLYDPEYAKLVNSLISTNKISQNFVLKSIRGLTYISQQIKFFGSIFHLNSMFKASLSAENGAIFNRRGWADFAKSFKKYSPADPIYQDYINLGGGHKYSVESKAQTILTDALDKIERGNYLGGLTKLSVAPLKAKYIPLSPGFIKWQFDEFIPTLKFEKFKLDVGKMEAKLGRSLTDAEKINIIKTNQNFYGEMNERLFGRSGTVTSALRLFFQAPGYGEGNFRSLFLAMNTKGLIKNTGMARRNAMWITNTFVTTLTMATIGTLIMTGKMPETPKTLADIRDLFKIRTGTKDGNGDDVFVDMMTYDKDFYAILGNTATGQLGEVPGTLSTRVSASVGVPFKIATDLATLFGGGMVYDYKGNPMWFKTDSFGKKISKFLQRELETAQPISASTFGSASRRGGSTLSSLGLSVAGLRPTTSEETKRAKNAISDLYSLQDTKRSRQSELNKLAGENVNEALKQAQLFNEEQKKKLFSILRKQGITDIPKSEYNKYLILHLRQYPPKEGTTVKGVINS